MRILVAAILIVANFILQTTILPFIAIRGVVPNTAMLIVISVALLRGSKEGALVGFFSGVLQDVFFATTMGYYTALLTALGFLIGRNLKHFYRENYILPVFFCILGAVIYESVLFLTAATSQAGFHIVYFLWRVLLPQIVYTGIVTIPIYRLLFALNEWLEVKEKYKYRLF